MCSSEKFGVVVVGLGIAGKVRVRDLKEEASCMRLHGVVSRRSVDIEDVHSFTLDEALSHPDVHALMISTEPGTHEEYVRKALENKKHVLVEYPVARSAATAKELFKLAEENGVVLYEENTALLTESFQEVEAKAEKVEIKSVSYSLSGSYNGWIENFDLSGLPFITGVSGLQVMISLFGDLEVVEGKLDKSDTGYSASALLKTLTGKPINITLSRSQSKDARREKHDVFVFEDGKVIDSAEHRNKSPGKKPGLFMRDMDNFCEAVKRGQISEKKKMMSIHSLEIAEKIHSFF